MHCNTEFNSKFLGKAAAQNIYKKFDKCISELDESKLWQVSSDGLNVNLVFFGLLNEHRSDNELSRLINIGTCGLHTIHNSKKHGENSSGWKLNNLLQSIYKIFEEAPKRRKKYEEITLAKRLTTFHHFVRTIGLNMKLLRNGLLRYGLEW